jgi:glycerol-3-phosphate dehydrogenase (NAD(P)+)
LSPKIKAVGDFSALISAVDLVFIVVPSVSSKEIFQKISLLKFKKTCGFVICSKGVEQDSLMLLSDAFEEITKSKNYAILSGPNFAAEVANEVPSITTIASRDQKLAKKIISVLNNDHFQARYCDDPRSVEICGIVKNIMAIGCGIIDGLGLGANAKAALLVKGISEITLLCKKFKASSDVTNAAGFGDIFLTCSSAESRNNRLGTLLAQGKTFAEIKKETSKTYEGASSAKAIVAIARKLKLRLDLCEKINQILLCRHSPEQIKALISKSILA